jgi:hypothetical protein
MRHLPSRKVILFLLSPNTNSRRPVSKSNELKVQELDNETPKRREVYNNILHPHDSEIGVQNKNLTSKR